MRCYCQLAPFPPATRATGSFVLSKFLDLNETERWQVKVDWSGVAVETVVATRADGEPESQAPGTAQEHTGHLFQEKYFLHLCMEKISTGSRAPGLVGGRGGLGFPLTSYLSIRDVCILQFMTEGIQTERFASELKDKQFWKQLKYSWYLVNKQKTNKK